MFWPINSVYVKYNISSGCLLKVYLIGAKKNKTMVESGFLEIV